MKTSAKRILVYPVVIFTWVLTARESIASAGSLQVHSIPARLESVVNEFNLGAAALITDIPAQGWKSGRCFNVASPSEALPGAILRFNSARSELSDISVQEKIAAFIYKGPSDSLDSTNSAKSKEASEFIASFEKNWSFPVAGDGNLQVKVRDAGTGRFLLQEYIRMRGRDLVMVVNKCKTDEVCPLADHYYAYGDTVFACYFFNDVH